MRNYIQPGHAVTLLAPYDVVSGAGLLVGSIFGVASGDAVSGAEVEAQLTGVVDLEKVGDAGVDRRRPGLLGRHQQARHERGHRQHAGSASRCSPSAGAPRRSSAGCGSTAASDPPIGTRPLGDHAGLPPGVTR